MDIEKAYQLGYIIGAAECLAMDADDEGERYIWRTIKKADSEGNGRKIRIDTETGTIVAGYGTGKTLAEAFKPKSEKIKEKLKDSVIQNRDRSSASSREQIRQISANPDYDRLGTSKTFTDGSPVVAFGKIPSKAYGKETRIVDSEGKKYTVKYAVVEADTLASSHDEQGFTNKEYSDVNNLDTVRAIAGNGRTAGIKAAYAKGNADEYKAELLKDTDHGVNPEYIKGLNKPVLVRVMNTNDVSKDIGDKTNTSNVMSYSNIDRANTDLARIDNTKLETDENGDLTYNGVKQFVESLPKVEQSQYYNAKGELNKQAQERAYMAMFKKAYTNNELFNKAFESLSNRTTLNLMTALKNASPSIANLKGLPDGYDVRGLITQGAIKYIKNTEKVTTEGQADMFLNAKENDITDQIAKELANRSRSAGRMERFLVAVAQNMNKEANKQDDMFGSAIKDDVKTVVTRAMAVDSDLCMSAEKLEVWNKYGCKLIEMIGCDDVQARYADCFHTLLASDTKEDGFVTLTDKSGKPYVAQLEESEKQRYKETGKKLSQVKKEAKEKQPKQDTQTRDQKFADLVALSKRLTRQTNLYDKKTIRSMSVEDLIDDLNAEFKTMPEIATGIEKELRASDDLNENDIIDIINEETDKYLQNKCTEFAENDPVAKDFRDELKKIQEKYLPQIKELNKEVGKEVTKDQYQKAEDLYMAYSKEKNNLDDKFKDKLVVPYDLPTGYWYDNKADQQNNEIIKLSRNITDSYLNQEKVKKESENVFRKFSPAGKFFGENGADRISNKYFFINHKPDDNTVILENVADRLRVTGKGDLIFLTDKNKGYFINEKNMLPVLSYNNDDNSHTLNLAVKLNKDYLKEYTFKKEFDATEGMMPITKGFEQLQQMAEVKDHPLNRTSYRNVDSKQVDFYKLQYLQNLYATQQAFRKPAETVSTGGKANDIDQYLKGWNKKIYKYKDGTRAIFSNNRKIVLTEEQYNYLKDKATN